MRRLGALVLAMACASAVISSRGEHGSAQAARLLGGGDRITIDVKPDETYRYTLNLSASDYLELRVHQRGVDIIPKLLADGATEPIAQVNSPMGGYVTEVIALVVDRAGSYTVEIAPAWPRGKSGRVEIDVTARPATAADRAHADAFRLLASAEQSRATGTAAGIKAASALYADAEAHFRTAGDAIGEADAVVGLGRVADGLGERRRAIELYLRARAMYKDAGNAAGQAFALNLAALTHDFLGTRTEAMALLTEALPLAEASGDPRVQALTFQNTGLIFFNTGDRRKALEFYERALPLHRAADNRRGEANTLLNIGSVKDVTGDKPGALDYMQRALAVRQQLGEPREEAIILNNTGTLHFSMDDAARALELYERALPRWREAGDLGGEAATLHNVGNAREFLGEYQQALQYYARALALHRRSGFKVGEANTLVNFGRLSATLGDYDEAIDAYTEALAIQRSANNRAGIATILASLADARAATGDPSGALALNREALSLMQALNNPLGEAGVRSSLGRLLAASDATAARLELERAQQLFRSVDGHRGGAVASASLAQIEARDGRHDSALQLVEGALAQVRATRDRTTEAAIQSLAARISRDRGDLVDARRRNDAAIEIFESVRSRVAQREFRTSYLATARSYYELAIDLLMRLHERQPDAGYDRQAFEVSERARARGLLDILAEARAGVREAIPPALAARELEVRQRLNVAAERQTRLLAGRAAADQIEAAARGINRLTAEYRQLETDIRLSSARYAGLVEPPIVPADAVQRGLLDPRTVLVEYALGAERSVAWVISPTRVATVSLAPRAEIDAAAERFAAAVGAPGTDAERIQAGRRLSALILAPIAQHLGAVRLLIAPDSALHYVPFAALPDGDRADTPLIARHEVVIVPSASTLAVLRTGRAPHAAGQRPLMIIADPVFSADDSRITATAAGPSSAGDRANVSAGQALPRLIGSRREAKQILALVPTSQARLAMDFDASRQVALGADLQKFRIVHFATHAVIDNRHPGLSGIALSSVDRAGRPQEGYLRLHDIYNLELGADLVVLSACRTALGRAIRGEGLIGLTRGFMYAGAPRVVASLWTVDDRATAQLMTEFYKGMLGPAALRPAAALRAAQLAVSENPRWRSPYYWAGFELQGEWK